MLTKAISCFAILILLGADWKSHYMLLGYSNKSINFRDLGCPCSSQEISPEKYRDTLTNPLFSRDLVCPNSSPEISQNVTGLL